MWWHSAIIAAGTIITGVLSWEVARRAQHNQRDAHHDTHQLAREERVDAATATLLSGYNDMVEDLLGEVERLNRVIENLRTEQEECERRNREMESVVRDLQRRLAKLEGFHHGE